MNKRQADKLASILLILFFCLPMTLWGIYLFIIAFSARIVLGAMAISAVVLAIGIVPAVKTIPTVRRADRDAAAAPLATSAPATSVNAGPTHTDAKGGALFKQLASFAMLCGVGYGLYLSINGVMLARSSVTSVSETATTSNNLFDKAMLLGVSTSADFQSFDNAGGFENPANPQWRGYRVHPVRIGYDERVHLNGYILDLTKSIYGSKLASFNNLRNDLSASCGVNWSSESNVHRSSDERCMVLDEANGDVELNIQLRHRYRGCPHENGQYVR